MIAFVCKVAGPDTGTVGGAEKADAGGQARRIWIMKNDGSEAHRLITSSYSREERPLWSRDGRFLLFIRVDSKKQASLWMADARGQDSRQVVVEVSERGQPEWRGYYGYTDWDYYFDWREKADRKRCRRGAKSRQRSVIMADI
jgi:Tol biopolymer transport system component